MMKESILNKLENLRDRFGEVEALLSDAEVINDQNRYRDLSREYSELGEVVKSFDRYKGILENLQEAEEMKKDDDAEIRAMAEDEITSSLAEQQALEMKLQKLLLPKDS